MIVIDSSAVCAVLLNEPERDRFQEIMARGQCVLPAACLVESSITWRRRGGPVEAFEAFLATFELVVLPADERQARIAAEADRRFGRAAGHPARLNFGDCLAYAAAIAHDAPLLFKGGDFGHTDVKRAA